MPPTALASPPRAPPCRVLTGRRRAGGSTLGGAVVSTVVRTVVHAVGGTVGRALWSAVGELRGPIRGRNGRHELDSAAAAGAAS